MTKNNFESAISVVSPLIILVLWEGLARLRLIEPLFFPAPSKIIETLIQMIVEGELQTHLSISLKRIFTGFFLGAIPGLFVGLAMGWSSKLRAALDPIVSSTYPIPKIALFPIIMLIFGIGEISKVVIIAIGSFFMVLINSMTGVRNIGKIYFEVAENYGANKLQMFTKVMLPGSLPMIFAGMRLALGMSLIIAVAIEFLSANEGLGAMIWLSWETLRTEKLYGGVIIIAFLGLLFTSFLQRIEKELIPWEEELLKG